MVHNGLKRKAAPKFDALLSREANRATELIKFWTCFFLNHLSSTLISAILALFPTELLLRRKFTAHWLHPNSILQPMSAWCCLSEINGWKFDHFRDWEPADIMIITPSASSWSCSSLLVAELSWRVRAWCKAQSLVNMLNRWPVLLHTCRGMEILITMWC